MGVSVFIYDVVTRNENLRGHEKSCTSRCAVESRLSVHHNWSLSNDTVDDMPHVMGDFEKIALASFYLPLRCIHVGFLSLENVLHVSVQCQGCPLTCVAICNTLLLVNRLSDQLRAQVPSMRVEGVSLRAISRFTGTEKNTFAKLLAEFGIVCATYHNRSVRNVRVRRLQCGTPDPKHIHASYIERQYLPMRMGMRRFTRLTNGFSKR